MGGQPQFSYTGLTHGSEDIFWTLRNAKITVFNGQRSVSCVVTEPVLELENLSSNIGSFPDEPSDHGQVAAPLWPSISSFIK